MLVSEGGILKTIQGTGRVAFPPFSINSMNNINVHPNESHFSIYITFSIVCFVNAGAAETIISYPAHFMLRLELFYVLFIYFMNK